MKILTGTSKFETVLDSCRFLNQYKIDIDFFYIVYQILLLGNHAS